MFHISIKNQYTGAQTVMLVMLQAFLAMPLGRNWIFRMRDRLSKISEVGLSDKNGKVDKGTRNVGTELRTIPFLF